jgi:hypothetical protein
LSRIDHTKHSIGFKSGVLLDHSVFEIILKPVTWSFFLRHFNSHLFHSNMKLLTESNPVRSSKPIDAALQRPVNFRRLIDFRKKGASKEQDTVAIFLSISESFSFLSMMMFNNIVSSLALIIVNNCCHYAEGSSAFYYQHSRTAPQAARSSSISGSTRGASPGDGSNRALHVPGLHGSSSSSFRNHNADGRIQAALQRHVKPFLAWLETCPNQSYMEEGSGPGDWIFYREPWLQFWAWTTEGVNGAEVPFIMDNFNEITMLSEEGQAALVGLSRWFKEFTELADDYISAEADQRLKIQIGLAFWLKSHLYFT